MRQKRWSFGLGTFFSLIVIYFIYLYAKEKGWDVLAFISKWYLIIVGGLIALSAGMILLVLLFSLLVLFIAAIKLRKFTKREHKKSIDYIDAEFKVK